MKTALYPLKFQPILKERIWGGNKLKTVFGKSTELDNIGESWEISDVEGDTSIIANGDLAGTTLKECLQLYEADLVGHRNFERFGYKFPLLIKFIDAQKDLSIQLHPNDKLAKERHNSFGKTEMWYVMQADEGANLIVGFNGRIDKEIYLRHLKKKTLTEILNYEQVQEGDTYFIEVGRVHAIGAGVMVAEIQQTSDITYRVYDWDRVDANGKSRELHTDLAIDAIDFDMTDNYKVAYATQENIANTMVECPYFTTNYIPVNGKIHKVNKHDSFLIYMCVDGEAEVEFNEAKTLIRKGETVLIPAAISHFDLVAENAKLLEVYV